MRPLTLLRETRVALLFGLLAGLLVLGACGGSDVPPVVVVPPPAPPAPAKVNIVVLSSRADAVSGGSAVVEMAVPVGLNASDLKLSLNGVDVSVALTPIDNGQRLRGLVSGLGLGGNKLSLLPASTKAEGELTLTNHAADAPVFSGPRMTPFECRTTESGLGAPLDANCSVATRFEWYYFTPAGARKALSDPLGARPTDVGSATTLEGKTVPFIVRVESGTLNRSIYRIAVLDDPQTAGKLNSSGWNRRIVFRFGESTAAQYNQGSNAVTDVFKADATDTQSIRSLERGFAYVVSSLNVNKVNVNDALAAETAMRIREHIAKTYGVPRWMVGMGGSGGAIQQMLIAQNYPGILDGIMPDAAFPDVFGTALAVSDCRLLNRYFVGKPASDATRRAFEGHLKNTCASWDAGNGDAVLATNGSINPACGLNDASKVYHPLTNPTGARCTVYDINVNSMGRDAFTGFARRPLDNVGVQYGLDALKKGQISATQFLDVNEGVGGFDLDGNLIARRTVADTEALSRAYETGRIGSGSGGLAQVPMLHMRAYAEPAGDIHTIYNDIKIREQLKKANGRADNQVIWLLPHPGLAPLLGLGNAQQLVLANLLRDTFLLRLTLMTQWLDAIGDDSAALSADKVARLKPADAVDSCWGVVDAQRIKEVATFSDIGACNALYAKTPTPRMAAGGPITDDVGKCQLKPIADAQYAPAAFSNAEKLRLAALFPDGVCDFSKPGVGQSKVKGTWLRY